MSGISFSIEKQVCNGELFLILNLKCLGPARVLYLDALKLLGKEAPDLSRFLIQEHCKQKRVSVGSRYADTLACNTICIPAAKSLEAMKLLALAKKLSWNGKSLFWNPLAKAEFVYRAVELDSDTLELTQSLYIDGEQLSLSSVEFLFPGSPLWGIHRQMVFAIKEGISSKWIQTDKDGPELLKGKKKRDFIELYREDPTEDIPNIVWEGPRIEKTINETSVLPFLILKDPHGAFAELWMNYGEGKNVNYHDPDHRSRYKDVEAAWERDLLETDFIRKQTEYYCPMDKVAKSLSFLLEIGWKIYDWKKRQLLHMTDSQLRVEEKEKGIFVKGSFRYDTFTADIKSVIGAFNRREKFIELSSDKVGLMDYSGWESICQDLSDLEVVEEGLLARKHSASLLGSLFEHPSLRQKQNLPTLIQRIENRSAANLIYPANDCKVELYPYQKEGLNWLGFLREMGFSGLLADEMGLGKTVQILAFLSTFSENDRVLVVAPTSLVFNWRKEWEKFLPLRSLYIHEGKDRLSCEGGLKEKAAILTSYSCLRIDQDVFKHLSFSCIILDEAQTIKNPESQISQVVCSLRAPMKVCMTGTPVENRVDDLWSIFHFLEPEVLGERKEFQIAASSADMRHLNRIKKKIRPFVLRRRKEEVAQDLPDKIEQVVWVEMNLEQRAFYEDWLIKTRQGLLKKVHLDGISSHRMEILEAILRLRQICCDPALVGVETYESSKLQRLMTDLEELVKQGRKVLIYSQFTQMLKCIQKQIRNHGWKFSYLDGSTQDRESCVTQFQEDPECCIFLISLKAGGVGLNLTAADYVFLFDPWWNEAVETQAIDRAHRFGRKDVVIARRYIVSESIEEKIMTLKSHKKALAKGLLDFDEMVPQLGLEDLLELLS